MKSRVLCAALITALVLAGCKGTGKNENKGGDASENQIEQTIQQPVMDPVIANAWENIGEEPVLKISTTDGDMTVRLYKDTPLHRDNFVKLAKSGFYDGILFHRVIRNFMIQVGDPLTKDSTQVAKYGTGGPDYTIPAEILPQFTHKKGALAAARRGDAVNPAKESSGSQFYIVHDAAGCSHLDGEYTIFGEVIEGLEVVDAIANEPVGSRDLPVKKIQIISIIPVTE